MSIVEPHSPRAAAPAPTALTIPVSNRLASTRIAGKMTKEYWDRLFSARERGAPVVWYNGSALNPFFQAAGVEWCHGEAFSARLAAMHLEGPAQLAAEEYGYIGELCSYSRTHLGCCVLTQRGTETESGAGIVSSVDQETLASRLPTPDFYINAYSGCSTGQQWDEIAYRIFDKEIPIFKVSFPHLWAIKPDAGYLRGEEWDEVSRYVADQLYAMVEWIELQTGPPVRLGCAARGHVVHQARGGDPPRGHRAVHGRLRRRRRTGTGSRASLRSTSCRATRTSSTTSSPSSRRSSSACVTGSRRCRTSATGWSGTGS